MRSLLTLFLLSSLVAGQQQGAVPALVRGRYPDAPSATKHDDEPPREKVGFWHGNDDPDGHAMRTNREVFTSKGFILAETVHLAAIAYDVELTHEGLAHHKCVENDFETPHPSRGQLYEKAIPEYAVSVLFGWLVTRYVWEPLAFTMPGTGAVIHIRAGTHWVTRCW